MSTTRTLLVGLGKGLPALAMLVCACSTSAERVRQPDVILIIVDTLRADHLGTYGYAKNISPTIDAFADRATVFENAISQAPHTIPSVLQIMTSLYSPGKQISRNRKTLAELLRAAGFETTAIVENANFEFTREAHGLRRGFDRFYRNGLLDPKSIEWQHWKTKTPADVITAQARRHLMQRESGRPIFLWLHYFDPHDPYAPPYADNMEQLSWESESSYTGDVRTTALYKKERGPKRESLRERDRRHLIDLYDAEIKFVDQSLGDLFDFLKARSLYDSSLIILTADHGESLGEHGNWTHGRSLYDPEIHIPLIVKLPYQTEGDRVVSPAQVIDVLPTILDVVGLEADPKLHGKSLLQPSADPAFAFWTQSQVVRSKEWKLLQVGKEVKLFRITTDPGESQDLSKHEPDVLRELAAARKAKLAAIGETAERLKDVSREVVEQMQALGYME